MTTVKVAAIMDAVTGIPEDAVQNTFHFHQAGGDPVVMAGTATAAIQAFYTDANHASGRSVSEFLSDEVSRAVGASVMKAWEVDEAAIVGPPKRFDETFLFEVPLVLDAAFDPASMVSEAACVLSVHGVLDGSDGDRRRRGRLYIGPLNTSAPESVATAPLRPGTTFRGVLVEGARSLFAVTDPTATDWVVTSRAELVLVSEPITAGWVDDAFDTQRRRGPARTLRQTFTLP